MKKFLKWLASSPTASALKIVLSGSLAVLINQIDSFDLPPVIALLIVAVIPLVIDALNPHDPRFGKGKTPTLIDFFEAIGPVLVAQSKPAETNESAATPPKKS
jgi:hypothetical protein